MKVYVAKCEKCGHVFAAATSDAPDMVADMVRAGSLIECVEGPVSLGGLCEHIQSLVDAEVRT